MNELLIAETGSHPALGQRRDTPFINSKPNCQEIATEALHKSIELLSALEYEVRKEEVIYYQKTCEFCQILFSIGKNQAFTCKTCHSVYCRSHRIGKEHNCLKKFTAFERYLKAKKVMSSTLRANKNKKRIDCLKDKGNNINT